MAAQVVALRICLRVVVLDKPRHAEIKSILVLRAFECWCSYATVALLVAGLHEIDHVRGLSLEHLVVRSNNILGQVSGT